MVKDLMILTDLFEIAAIQCIVDLKGSIATTPTTASS
jgi:hypothetical protein